MNNRYITKSGESIKLDSNKSFASGGEGSIFLHPSNKNKAIKIYHKPKSAKLVPAYDSLGGLDGEFFIKPEEILFNNVGEIAGFTMEYIDVNKFFIYKKLTSKSFCDQNGYDRKFKYKVYTNLKKAIEGEAHKKNIVIGDLNPYNILINDKAEIKIVDVDSFATKEKPHNGVLLDDIRDWVNFGIINQKTDAYSFDVLMFWMFTYTHPYRGTCDRYKNLEERVVKDASVLANIPDIILPPVYQPFTNQDIIKQFFEVFQKRARFFVDMDAKNIIPTTIPSFQPVNFSSNDLHIRLIDDDIFSVDCTDRIMAVKRNSVWKIYNLANYGTFNLINNVTADKIFVGGGNYVKMVNNVLHFNEMPIKNVTLHNVNNCNFLNSNNALFVTDNSLNNLYRFDLTNIVNNYLQHNVSEIFSPSIQIGDGIIQQIGDNKWMIIPNGVNQLMVKTSLNIKNFYYKNNIICIEHIENNKIKYGLFKLNGLSIEHIYDLPEFSYFDMKGDFIFIPDEKQILLVSILRKDIVMKIDCPVSKNYSKLFQTNAGMVLYTDQKVYLINKKV